MTGPEDDDLSPFDDDGSCWNCCEGFLDGLCTCGDDSCCCLEPDPPVCDVCNGTGYLPPAKLSPAAEALRDVLADALAKAKDAP